MLDFLMALSPSRFRSGRTLTWWAPSVPVPVLVLVLVLVLCGTGSQSVRLLPGAEVNCSQQGLSCSFSHNNCLDQGWLQSHQYTPSGPDHMDLRISTRPDPRGLLLPVLEVTWRLRDDGSISFLKATEVQVLVVTTNENTCFRFTFRDQLPMRNPAGDQWQFSLDVVVVNPGQIYWVSVDNVPKPELDHSSYRVSQEVSVPDCRDPLMKQTQPCIECGALWSPNISASVGGGSSLTVLYSPHPLSEEYSVHCRCLTSGRRQTKHNKGNSSRLSASFDLGLWVTSCCLFSVEIKPYFSCCGNDCERHQISLNICPPSPTEVPVTPWTSLVLVLSSTLVLFLCLGVCGAILCRRRKGYKPPPSGPGEDSLVRTLLEDHPRLLLIYSKDHPLYQDVVLKLCAFLQAQCGIVVLLDLLDSSSVSQVGVLRWLELQRQKLRPSDKILVLCSRGVQATWRSMCGQGHPSPIMAARQDDLIAPFLSLFLSDLHCPGSMGRYMAAYFEDFSSEGDVPSFFDIAVKYKLMKHFEELLFRLLDMEKYEPCRVNHVEGIGPDEYFLSDSGLALRNAIESFQVFQVEHPHWLENASKEEEEAAIISLLSEDLNMPQILECVPIVRDDFEIYTNNISENKNLDNFYEFNVCSDLLNETSIAEVKPILNPSPSQSIVEVEPVPRPENFEIVTNNPVIQISVEEPSEEEEAEEEDEEEVVSGEGQNPKAVVGFVDAKQSSNFETRRSEPVEMDEFEELAGLEQLVELELEIEGGSKGPSSGSDQGYSSKVSTEMDSEDMKALLRLQQELMQGICDFEID